MSDWVRVCAADELASATPLRVTVEDTPVCVVRTASGVHAIGDTCSHAQVSLSEGFVSGDEIECWLHGASFDLVTGAALALPATQPVPVYTVDERADGIYLRRPEGQN
jgi:3-phenylpropionate/trans-cinnamate dioxygenase ferredoxin component